MKSWTWLLPCWVWKYFFAQLPREQVRLDGRTRFLIRLDEEFALVYDPHATETMLTPSPETHRLLSDSPATQTCLGLAGGVKAARWVKQTPARQIMGRNRSENQTPSAILVRTEGL